MASDGTRIFVLGGALSKKAQEDETALIHVMDTSTYNLFVISFGQPSYLKAQSTPSIQIPIPTMSGLVRRSLDWRGSHLRGPPPWKKTTMAKVRPSAVRSWERLMLLLREELVRGQTRDASPGNYFSLRAPATTFLFHVR
jgi:hypothetical protein